MDQRPQPTIREVIPRALLYFLLFWGLPGIVAGLIYAWELRHDEERTRIQSLHVVDLCAGLVERTLDAARSDLLFLARQRILQRFMGQGHGAAEVEREYASFAGERGCYHHIRLLGADGRELVRVNLQDGHPVIAAPDALQLKITRYYFPVTWALAPGQIYTSGFDLNMEHGRIEEPWRPALCLSTPVTDVQGAKRGVLVLSLDGAQLLDELTELGLRAPGPTMLLNASGSYLSGVPPERRWGFLFGRTDLSFRVDHPEAWARISAQRSGQIQTRNGIFSFAAIGEGQNALRIVSQVPAEESRKGANRLFERLLWVGGAASIPLFVLSAYLAHAREARRRQRKAIVDSERRLRSLSERLFSLQEQERRSISRDLHDELGQLVTAITIELRGAAKAAPESTAGHIRRAEKAASLLLQELHGVVARLRPTILDDLGLLEAIRSYARDFERTTGIALELRLDPSSHPIPPKVSESVYRIVQEGLTNAAKHAGSESITLSMVASEDRVIVEIADDGEGFDPRATESDRFGLLGMRERAELMGGELVLHSTPGEGTRISLSVPLERGFGPEEHLS